jgi:hypothetical protein
VQDDFNIFLPIEKGSAKEQGGERFVYGVASTEDLDLDDEIVSASGLRKSMDYFLKHGRIDYDHKSKESPKFIIGEPIEGRFDSENKLHLKGRLYKGLEVADDVWKLLKADSTRLGWSIGGKVKKKVMAFDKSLARFVPKITEVFINHVAITPHPKNTHTHATSTAYGDFMKSLASPNTSLGTIISIGGVEYVLAERGELEKAMSASGGGSPVIPQDLEKDIKVFQSYVKSEHFTSDAKASREWFKSQGVDDETSEALASYCSANHKRILEIRKK